MDGAPQAEEATEGSAKVLATAASPDVENGATRMPATQAPGFAPPPTHDTPSTRTIPREMSSQQMDAFTFLEGDDDATAGTGVDEEDEDEGVSATDDDTEY